MAGGSAAPSSTAPSNGTGGQAAGWRRLAANLALSASTLLFLLAVLEMTLRLSGFSFVLYPEDIEFGRPDPVMLEVGFTPDDDLFWVTRDYGQKLEELRQKKPPLLLLGDSCTHLGRWDRALAGLAEDRLGRRPRFGNLAVAGWSSYQGRRQVERDVPALEPRVVTVYYGWNDHWIGFGIEDRNVARVRRVFFC
ncbi:MAG: SGNH/GDSL hydrolase family protein [Acidobacteriota bacterium]